MSTAAGDDDPTHALDDFVRRMRPAALAAAELPDLSALQARLNPDRPSAGARPKSGKLRNGQTWDADDVVDVSELALPKVDLAAERARAVKTPDIALPAVDSPAPLGAAELDASTRRASASAASRQAAEKLTQDPSAWQPDLQSLQLRRPADPRLLASWQPGAWTGALREVFESTAEFITTPVGTAVETYPPHRLLLLWPPQHPDAPTPSRWPQVVRLSASPADQADQALLALVPADAPLWLNRSGADIDWALAAEIVLHHDSGLRPFQTQGLRAFIAAEREATFARLNADYQQAAPGGPVLKR